MIAEPVLLGCCITDALCLDKAIEAGITTEHFTEDDRQLLWKTFVEIRSQCKSIDLLTVSLILGKNCPFTEYSSCEGSAPTTLNFKASLEAVLWARKAFLIKLATETLASRLNAMVAKESVLDAVTKVQEVSADTGQGRAADIAQIAKGVEQEFQDVLEHKPDLRRRFPMPLPVLDRDLGPIYDNELVMVAARPSVGKTSFCVQMAAECMRAGYNVAFIPTEVEAKDIIRQISSQYAKVNLAKLDQEFPENIKKAKEVAAKVRESKRLRVFDSSTEVTLIWSWCRAVREWADIVVIDHLAQLRDGKSAGRYESVTEICSQLVALKKMLRKPVIVAHQLKRLDNGGKNTVPGLQDLRDSGAAEQDASRVLLIHYPDTSHVGIPQTGLDIVPPDTRDYYIIQAKHRFGVRDVSVKVKYKATITRFFSTSEL